MLCLLLLVSNNSPNIQPPRMLFLPPNALAYSPLPIMQCLNGRKLKKKEVIKIIFFILPYAIKYTIKQVFMQNYDFTTLDNGLISRLKLPFIYVCPRAN